MKKKISWVIIISLLTVMAGCEVRGVVTERPSDIVYDRGMAPGSDYIWISGDWVWTGGNYRWRQGRWERRHEGRAWHDGRWEQHKNGWRWRNGHW